MNIHRKFYQVRRNDEKHQGTVVEIPEEHLAQTLRNHPKWEVIDENAADVATNLPKPEEAPKAPALECPLCGAQVDTEDALATHKKTHTTGEPVKPLEDEDEKPAETEAPKAPAKAPAKPKAKPKKK